MKKEKNEKIDKKNKKINKENILKNIDFTSKKIDIILHSKLILAAFMILDGINFILYPDRSMNGMAQTVASTAFLAAGAIIITYIKTEKKDIKTLTLPILMLVISGIIFIFPKPFAMNLRLIIALFIILNGLINIFNIKKLDKVSASLTFTENKLKGKLDKGADAESDNSMLTIGQTNKIINPISNVIEKANEKYYLYLILNIISVFLGILLFTTDNITIVVCGVILIYTGLFDLLMYLRSRRLEKKSKEKNRKKTS